MKPLTLSRRSFVRTVSAASAGLAVGSSVSGAEKPGRRRLKEIGIIGGVPKDMADDWQESLRRMAEIGYTILEGGPRGTSPEDYLKFLREIGLRLVSCGVRFGRKRRCARSALPRPPWTRCRRTGKWFSCWQGVRLARGL